jgi:inorganic pyrophosphatase
MQNLQTLPARSKAGAFRVVVESPKGSQVKFKYDPQTGTFRFSRPLVAGLHYPFDWGFVPGTCAPDGDPLDAMVFFDAPTYPGVIIECRALGVIRLRQNRKSAAGRERNDRLLAIPVKAPHLSGFREPSDLPARWRQEIEEFFLAATRFENKNARILGWGGASRGEKMVDDAVALHCP